MRYCAGGPRLQILVERADVPHYKKALDGPFFALALRDANGALLESELATPPGHLDREAGCIAAGHAVTFRTPIMDIPEGWCTSDMPYTLASSHLLGILITCIASAVIKQSKQSNEIVCVMCTVALQLVCVLWRYAQLHVRCRRALSALRQHICLCILVQHIVVLWYTSY